MRRRKGRTARRHPPTSSSKLTVASCAPEQELESIQTSSSRVLRIRAARSWVKSLRVCVCVSPRSALCATSAPRRTEKGLRPHRCSWRPISPDIFGAPGRGCVEVVRTRSGVHASQTLIVCAGMAPKKKAPEATGPSAPNPPPMEQTGGGEDAGGGTGAVEPVLGPATSELAPRPSQEARNQQRHGTHGTIRSLDPDRAGGSQGAQDQHAIQRAGTSVARLPGPGAAPSNIVRSSSTSRSSRRSPPLPATLAEALARAQLLLDYPPAADKLDGWRATIQSLIGFANDDTPRQHSASQPRPVAQARTGGAKTGGGATTLHSPHQRQRSPTRRTHHDNDSTASSNPRTRRDQRQVLHERREEDARTRIERRREARRQSDRRAEPSGDMHALGEPGDLPYSVGCPAFTRELRQVQWPSTKNFKPDIPEKYDGKSHPSEFLSIYTIALQAAGGGTTRSLPTTSRWCSNPTSGPGSRTCRTTPYLPGQTCAISLSAPLQASTNLMARRVTFICSPRRKESPCASSFRDSAVYNATSQMSTPPR